jgi:hypothetical protein
MTLSPPRHDVSQDPPDSAQLLIKEARRQMMLRRLRLIVVAIIGLIVVLVFAVMIGRSTAPTAKTTATSRSTHVAVAPCMASQLRLGDLGSDVATGHWTQLFEMTNVSEHACSLKGYPGVTLLTAAGPDATLRVTHIKAESSIYIGDSLKGPVPTATLSARGGRASFWIAGSDMPLGYQPPSACGFATEVLVKPPGTDFSLKYRVGRIPFTWCENTIQATPVLAGRSGSIPVEPLCIYTLHGASASYCKHPVRF